METQREIPADVYCLKCGYQLYGAPGERCPECGCSLEGLRAEASQIPWVYRNDIGWIRAFWKTVWLVTFRHRTFCEEYARDVAYRDARRFQCVTVLHALAPVLAGLVFFLWNYQPPPDPNLWGINLPIRFPASMYDPDNLLEAAVDEVWPFGLIFGGFVLLIFGATGLPSYFFHPRSVSVERQNTAVAMSYYACAPLAWSLVLVVFVFILIEVTASYLDLVDESLAGPHPAFAIGAVVSGLIVTIAWAVSVILLSRRCFPQLRIRWVVTALGIPAAVCGLAVITMALLPLSVVLTLVIIESFKT